MHWNGAAWELRDLGSRNGTFLEDKRLAPGERAILHAGATFSIADTGALFSLQDPSPPSAAAFHKESGHWRMAVNGQLALPNGARPEVLIFLVDDGTWRIERDGQARQVADAEILTIGSDTFVLEVPAPNAITLPNNSSAPSLKTIRMRFVVSPDEEHVETTVFIDGTPHLLAPRRYHYLLATLARAWLADEGVDPSVRGWVDREELCDKLDMDVNKLNVEIHRARQQLTALSVQGSAGLIERRPGTHEVRIGVPNVEVVRG